MSTFPQDDFSVWQDRMSSAGGVAELSRRLDSLPAAIKRAVFAHTSTEQALTERLATASDLPLAGIPYAVKDLYDVAGFPTGAGSTFLSDVRTTPQVSSPLVAKLDGQGAIFSAKTQLNEFAFGTSGENPHYGNCPHPTVAGALTGGSSSGSAYAVAAGLVPLALGTDTAGSIRIPAAFCGLYGLKLSPNAWSQTGCFPLAPSFDCAGWLTANSTDMQQACQHLLPEGEGSVSLNGLYLEHPSVTMEPALQSRADALCQHLELESDPEAAAWFWQGLTGSDAAFSIIRNREVFEIHEAWLDVMENNYSPVVWERINRGRTRDDQALTKAWEKRTAASNIFNELFARYDYIVMPITPRATPQLDQLSDDFRSKLLALNIPASFCGLPSLTIPLPLPDGRSGGLQFIFRNMNHMPLTDLLSALAHFHD